MYNITFKYTYAPIIQLIITCYTLWTFFLKHTVKTNYLYYYTAHNIITVTYYLQYYYSMFYCLNCVLKNKIITNT